MARVVLQAEGLGKRYLVRRDEIGAYSLRDKITRLGHRTISRLLGNAAQSRGSIGPGGDASEFWALRDVCLSVEQGEVLGLIGRNGAGKSTLLKIISRITEPSEGSLTIRGRVASLLEVGTGFHHELTGRENVFLNGAVLGMTRSEIRRKFDQIVAFADIGEFLDTPVKRYSSGMYVRLAFAVAAHLDPEIMIVDEVLAVGDEVFQRKCIERMSEVAKEGRTVLFVSHNLALIRMLCERGVVLAKSRVVFDGTAEQAVSHYLTSLEERDVSSSSLRLRRQRDGNGESVLTDIRLSSIDDVEIEAMEFGKPARLAFRASTYVPGIFCQFTILNIFGQAVTSFDSSLQQVDGDTARDSPTFICELDAIRLLPGRYSVNAGLYCQGGEIQLDHLDSAFMFEVTPGNALEARLADPADGYVVLGHRWIPRR